MAGGPIPCPPKQKRQIIMADYFTNFSFTVELPTKEAATKAIELHHKIKAVQFDDTPLTEGAGIPKQLHELRDTWAFEVEIQKGRTLWFNSTEGGIDAVCAFVQYLLGEFDPQGRVQFEWSSDCSQPRTNAYGGGAAIVTEREIKSLSTRNWLEHQTAHL